MPRTDRGNGRAARYYPLRARDMEAACRKLAADLREEFAAGLGPVSLSKSPEDGVADVTISRLEAAENLELQADRWEAEWRTGVPNREDRAKIGW